MKIQHLFLLVFTMGIVISACNSKGTESTATPTEEAATPAPEAAAVDTTAPAPEGEGPEYTSAYICPMHCEGSGSDQPGNCPKCGMAYEKREEHSH